MAENKISAGIIGVGSCVPPKVVTNDDIAKMGLETSDEWIRARTGIGERRLADNLSTSDLALQASINALKSANKRPEEIDLIITATCTPDHPLFPSVACIIQDKLGAKNAAAFDLSAACSGFVYALATASQFIEAGSFKNILVIGADTLAKNVDWTDRGTCILFGDAAGAVILSAVPHGEGILSWTLGAQGSGGDLLIIPNGGSRTPLTPENITERNHYIKMDGRAVFKFAVSIVIDSIEKSLSKAGLSKKNIDYFIPHQANKRIIDFAAERLGLSEEKVCVNIMNYGNTSSASIPLALDEAVTAGKVKKGDLVAIMGFGGGLTWGSAIFRWMA
ncbi:MAG: 3-oxoacyl-ACP synthase [Candidatus Margulisiibacteriota bacterium]|nr:MAG: 3-oxoacyl-ACP synthase [Candidatus Margulisbacteria bacterium GWD2_39_127]OGI01556.1 MAG: 3-oxoacyl-ACP synthase [Candidatus Margulisbacteria bacterium GWF2_38_17]OGI09997.1 MAG: 3-oxoacyl-ACP synthase [Candidatus Margulisbacteria bacterium GWE2_39_32]PZM78252.1 MAG: 3-oxoacyl-ACP synthase [Candidatus Margulisiibacteriota bacterium]HAR61861.1 3-oxoacyl-ACP synthase [Candidatus Margulisiibacteriota bacterium]